MMYVDKELYSQGFGLRKEFFDDIYDHKPSRDFKPVDKNHKKKRRKMAKNSRRCNR